MECASPVSVFTVSWSVTWRPVPLLLAQCARIVLWMPLTLNIHPNDLLPLVLLLLLLLLQLVLPCGASSLGQFEVAATAMACRLTSTGIFAACLRTAVMAAC